IGLTRCMHKCRSQTTCSRIEGCISICKNDHAVERADCDGLTGYAAKCRRRVGRSIARDLRGCPAPKEPAQDIARCCRIRRQRERRVLASCLATCGEECDTADGHRECRGSCYAL